jgi:hypothetical protein
VVVHGNNPQDPALLCGFCNAEVPGERRNHVA